MGNGEKMQLSSQAEATKISEESSVVWMLRDPSWGRQVWLYSVPCAMGLEIWNFIKSNQSTIKQRVLILHLLPNYSGLIKWRVIMGPLIGIADTSADGNLEGKKERGGIIWEL